MFLSCVLRLSQNGFSFSSNCSKQRMIAMKEHNVCMRNGIKYSILCKRTNLKRSIHIVQGSFDGKATRF